MSSFSAAAATSAVGVTPSAPTSADESLSSAGLNEAKSTEVPDSEHEAATNLMKVFSLGRSASTLDECRLLTRGILASPPHAAILPQLICYLRNHAKSLGQGQGKGEKKVAETMAVALFMEDPPAGKMLMRMLVCYGSWKSLSTILEQCDEENSTGSGKGKSGANWSGEDGSPFTELVSHIHELFACQLKQDLSRLDSSIGAVSNCSKFAPHEGRSKNSGKHADCIARLLFGKAKVRSIRREYRKLRSKINEANGYMADRMLAMGRAGDLDPARITAGYFAKSRRALLNLPKPASVKNAAPPASKKRRYDDPARIDLRRRVLQFSSNVSNIPAPSSIAELAESMLAWDDGDDGLDIILNLTYERALMELTSRIKGRTNEVMKLRKALGKDEDGSSSVSLLREVLVAVDVSRSQSHCLHVCALMCLLFADASDKLAEGEAGKSIVRDHWCCIFDRGASNVQIPPRSCEASPTTTPIYRLVELTKVFRAGVPRSSSENSRNLMESVDVGAAIDSILELQSGLSTKHDILLCSDFNGDEAVTAAERYSAATDGGTICAWKMSAPHRVRGRKISWDPSNPQIDICFVLDTTGSMGRWINACKEQVVAILDALQGEPETTTMPVSCSFVSYKDFGDANHLEVHPWSNANDTNAMRELRSFIASLRASGGGDIEEDVAGGFEKARDLMAARSAPSIKLVLLIADAAGHGYPMGRPNHGGVDQKKRLESVTRDLCDRLGCELLLTRITGHTTSMREDMDSWLASYRTFVDEFSLAGASSAVFKDKIIASLKEVVAHAVSPPSAKGIDVYGGCDFGVMTSLCTTRLAEFMAEVNEAEREEESNDAGALSDKKGSVKSKLSAPSAFQNMLAKCTSDDYDIVRTAMGALNSGVFANYTPPSGHGLAEASVRALIDAGATLSDIEAAGYPKSIVKLFETVIESRMTRGAAKKNL